MSVFLFGSFLHFVLHGLVLIGIRLPLAKTVRKFIQGIVEFLVAGPSVRGGAAAWVTEAGLWETTSETAAESMASSNLRDEALDGPEKSSDKASRRRSSLKA